MMMNKDITRFKRIVCDCKTIHITHPVEALGRQIKSRIPYQIVIIIFNLFFWFFLGKYAASGLLKPGFNHLVLCTIVSTLLKYFTENKKDEFYLENKTVLEKVVQIFNCKTENKIIGYYEELINDYEENNKEEAKKCLFKMYRTSTWLNNVSTFLFYLGVFFCMYLRCSGYGNPSFFLFIAILVLNTLSTKLINKLVIKIYKNYSKGGR